jgi:outer membrane protein assembly factor BamB
MSGDLWGLCDGINYATRKSLTTLYRLNGATGDLNFTREIPQPGPTDNWSITQHLIPTGDTVSLLSDLLHPKSGKVQYREGVALTRFNAHGEPSPTKTITSKNQSLQASIPGPNGSFYLGTDQQPLFIRHFNANGALLWARRLATNQVLPTLAAFPNGALCATAQTPKGLQLLRLGPTGAVTHQTPIAAKQGTVAAGPAGTCALLASDNNRAVTLSAYNAANQPEWKTGTPLTAPGGRTYSLHALPNGYLATDEKLIAKYTHTGKLEWSQPLPVRRSLDSIAVTGNTVYLLYGLAGDSAFHVVKLSIP